MRREQTDYTKQLVDHLRTVGDYSPYTILFYDEESRLVLKVLSEVDPESDPSNLDVETLKSLIRVLRERYAVSTQKNYIVALRRMCELNDNYVFRKHRIIYQEDTRPNVDWLTYDQARELLDMWKMPIDDMIVCLELLEGLRKVEVLRLRLDDIHLEEGYLDITGKGRMGGKLRIVPLHPDFMRYYDRWMKDRDEMVRKAESGHSDKLLIYVNQGVIKEYQETKGKTIERHMRELSDRLGFHFTNHTLRRTFGRELFRSGVSIEVIATIFGHSSSIQTRKYLGLDLDDMQSAMEIYRLRRD